MGQQALEPPRRDGAVAVDEGHQLAPAGGQPVVARRTRTAAPLPPDQPGARRPAGPGHRPRVGGTVVHHHHRRPAGQGGQAAPEGVGPVAGRDHHRHRRSGPGRDGAGPGVGHPGPDQPAGQGAGGVVGRPGDHQAGEGPGPRGRQGHHPPGMAADQDGAAPVGADGRVEHETPPLRQGRHNVRPPSTGSTAPVTAELPVPANHTRAAATSSGVRRRPMVCCWAKAPRSGSP